MAIRDRCRKDGLKMKTSNTNRKKSNKSAWRKPLDNGFTAGKYYASAPEISPDVEIRKGCEFVGALLKVSSGNMFVLDSAGNYMAIGKDSRNFLGIDRKDIVEGRATIITNIKDREPLLKAFCFARCGTASGSKVCVKGADKVTRELEMTFTPVSLQGQLLLIGSACELRRIDGSKKGGS
jgi:hypothetical protein